MKVVKVVKDGRDVDDRCWNMHSWVRIVRDVLLAQQRLLLNQLGALQLALQEEEVKVNRAQS